MTHSPRSTRRLATILLSTGLAAILATGTVLAGTPVTNGYRDHAYGGGASRPLGRQAAVEALVHRRGRRRGPVVGRHVLSRYRGRSQVRLSDLQAQRGQDRLDRHDHSHRRARLVARRLPVGRGDEHAVRRIGGHAERQRPVRGAHYTGRHPGLQVQLQQRDRHLHGRGRVPEDHPEHIEHGQPAVPRWVVDRHDRQGLDGPAVDGLAEGQ